MQRRFVLPVLGVIVLTSGLVGASALAGGGSPSETVTSAAALPPPVTAVAVCSAPAPVVPVVSLDPALRASGDPVRAVQVLLGVPADGVYGPVTAAAVAAWSGPQDGCTVSPAARTVLDALAALLSASDDLTAQAQAAQAAAALRVAQRATVAAASGSADCAGHIIPGYILQRESGCSYDAFNPTGCNGGCIGLYQESASHFAPGGACAGLGTDPAGQDACAAILSNGGTNLDPWAQTR